MSHVSTCRRCTLCDGLTHHWLPDIDDNDPPLYCYACKHCPAIGNSCTWCEGDDDADPECPVCHGEGVLVCGERNEEDGSLTLSARRHPQRT